MAIRHISRDAYIDTSGKGVLVRKGLDNSKHLLWRMGGVPCINLKLWEKYREYVGAIEVITNKQKFWCLKSDFEKHKVLITNGKEKQLTVDKHIWWVEDVKQNSLF